MTIVALVALGCKTGDRAEVNSNTTNPVNTKANSKPSTSATPSTTSADENSGYAVSTAAPGGKDIPAPTAGNGQIWGQVMFNSKPVEKIEAKLCEKLMSFMLQCTGKTYKAVTDAEGTFLIKDVPPGEYGGLIVKVFTTNFYVYEASMGGIAKKYKIEADKTFFMNDTNLFKNDLKPLTPKAGSRVGGSDIEFSWQEYPDAEYYTLSVSWAGKDYKTAPLTSERVEATSYKLDKTLEDGEYYLYLNAFNTNNEKLAQSPSAYKFSVKGGTAAPAAK
jgi:hypothetical protein